jgi:hypothetical protein
MTRLAEDHDYVVGGDPDRDTIDLATATGSIHAHIEASADGDGYARMLAWAGRHAPGRRAWALEGTGSFAAGLAGELALAGQDAVEVGALRLARVRRTTASTRSGPAGPRWPGSTSPVPASEGCVKRQGPWQRPATRCWSAAPRPSANSRASSSSHRRPCVRPCAAVSWPTGWP